MTIGNGHSEEHLPPCHSEERLPSLPFIAILRSASPPCHSEERTTKNLRCRLTQRLGVVMDRPSGADLRFLTPFRNDSEERSE